MANTTNIDLVKPLGTDHALISVINSNYDKIDTEAGKVRSNMALVQNTNTATEAIAKDQLVLWKGVLKKATSAIASGATLSSSNLANTDIADELAALKSEITPSAITITAGTNITIVLQNCKKIGNLVVINAVVKSSVDISTGETIITLPRTSNGRIDTTMVAIENNDTVTLYCGSSSSELKRSGKTMTANREYVLNLCYVAN